MLRFLLAFAALCAWPVAARCTTPSGADPGLSRLPLALALLTALLCSVAALAAQLAALRAQRRLALRQEARNQEFGPALIEACREIAALGALQKRGVDAMQLQARRAAEAAIEAARAGADSAGRIGACTERMERALSIATAGLMRAEANLTPLVTVLRDLPEAVQLAIQGSAQETGRRVEDRVQNGLFAVHGLTDIVAAMPRPAAIAAAAAAMDDAVARVSRSLALSEQAARSIAAASGHLAGHAAIAEAAKSCLDALTHAAGAARQERSETAELAALIARLCAHVEGLVAGAGDGAVARAGAAAAAKTLAAARTQEAAQRVAAAASEAGRGAEITHALRATMEALLAASRASAAPDETVRGLEAAAERLAADAAERAA